MKKVLAVFATGVLLSACSLPFMNKETKEGVPRGAQPPVTTTAEDVAESDFYFEAGKDGLVLKLVSDKNFSQKLSSNPIDSADIADGILTFVEKIGNGTQTQVFQLDALSEQLNLQGE